MNLSDIGWAWFLCGLILGFLLGAMYGVRKQVKARLRHIDGTVSVRHAPESPFFDGDVHFEQPLHGQVVTDRGWRKADLG